MHIIASCEQTERLLFMTATKDFIFLIKLASVIWSIKFHQRVKNADVYILKLAWVKNSGMFP